MKKLQKKLIVTTFLLGIAFGVFATDGYFSTGYGTQNKGYAGAGLAYFETSLINGNPAGLVQLGKTFQVGLALFNPNREYTVFGNPSGMQGTFGLAPGTVKSSSRAFPIPHFGANWILKNEKTALSFAFFANGGMNTDYENRTYHDQSSATTGVNLEQMFGGLSASHQFNETHSLGVTLLLALQRFEAEGLSNFANFSIDRNNLTGRGVDISTGIGFKIGYMGNWFDRFTFSAVYQSKILMSEFDDYRGLFAEQGDFDIPSSWTISVAYDITDELKIMADVKQINYSEVNSVGNPFNPQTLSPQLPSGAANPNFKPLGSDESSGFGWDDIMVYKLGLSYKLRDDLVFRLGFSHNENPISDSEVLFNILAPGVIENHFSLGFSKNVGKKGNKIHFAFIHALNESVKGPNPLEIPNQQNIKLEMNQFNFELGFSF